ncbi:MAG: peptidylprolyl isomerase [Candidatus Zixiibacteriota bacterium]
MKRTMIFSVAAALMIAAAGIRAQTEKNDSVKSKSQPATEKKVTVPKDAAGQATFRYPIRDKANKFATLETDAGKLVLELYHDVAPNHADSFAARCKDGFYVNTIFHRVIDGFMIQGGDPNGDGTGGAAYKLKAEFNKLPHVEGTLSMARAVDPNSASTQFFICLGRAAALDGQYTNFGHLIKGYDVLHKIGSAEVVTSPHGEKSKPKVPVKVLRAYPSDAEGNKL